MPLTNKQEMAKKYEYKVMNMLQLKAIDSNVEEALNSLGFEGWELCGLMLDGPMVFKRELQQQ